MNYSTYDKDGKLLWVNSAKNKSEMINKVLESKNLGAIACVQYGRKVYSIDLLKFINQSSKEL